MPQKEKLKTEEKITLIRRYQEGEIGFSEAVMQAGGDKKTFRRWVKRYEAEGVAGFLPYKPIRMPALFSTVTGGFNIQTDFSTKNWKRPA